jgi:acyl-CoA synthetase (NDP forming)
MDDRQYEGLDAIFHPRSMAAVGVAERVENMGMSFLRGYRKMGFKGPLYAIHPQKKLAKFETFSSLEAVPGPVDFVQISLPARLVPGVVRECGRKGVRAVSIFSSGFRESGTAEGEALEEELVRAAREGGVRVIGPNCMGIYCPESGMSLRGDMTVAPDGELALLSQSGGIAISAVMAAAERGIGFCKAVSYGNECDLGPPELLPYLARDPKVRVICLYIEGTRRPEELRSALTAAAAQKPVVLLKGGATAAGSRAVSSHTGALTGTGEVWRALARQAGCSWAEDLDELIDLAMLYSLSAPPAGKRLGLLTISGGFGVFATDQVIRAGFEMPPLAAETREALAPYLSAPGTSLANPVDMAAKFFQPQNYETIFGALDRDPNFDAYLMIVAMEYMTYLGKNAKPWSEFVLKALIAAMKKIRRPIYVAFLHTAVDDIRLAHERTLIASRLPVFPTVARCLTAIERTMRLSGP